MYQLSFIGCYSGCTDGCSFTLSIPILTNVDIAFDNLDSSLFPGVSSSVKVHKGFSEAQERYVLSPR